MLLKRYSSSLLPVTTSIRPLSPITLRPALACVRLRGAPEFCLAVLEASSPPHVLHHLQKCQGLHPHVLHPLAKSVYKLKNTDESTFYSPVEARATPAPTSKSPEERAFVVDSEASMHMLSKKDSSSDEMETLRRSRNPTTLVTANGRSAIKRGRTSIRSRS